MDQQHSGRAVAVTSADNASPTIEIAGKTVHRLGFGAMRLVGPRVWGEPANRGPFIWLVRRVVPVPSKPVCGRPVQRGYFAGLGAPQLELQQVGEQVNPVDSVRHAQAVQDWSLAARLFADHWPSLYLDGQTATTHELIAGFPAGARAADAELAVLAAGEELAQGSLEKAEWFLGLAERGSSSVPADRRGQFRLLLGVVRLLLARLIDEFVRTDYRSFLRQLGAEGQ